MKKQNITKANYLGMILAKKISDKELEPNEKAALDEWLLENQKNQNKYEEIFSCKERELSDLLSLQDDIDKSCDRLMLRVVTYNKKLARRRRLFSISGIAAAVIILFMALPLKIDNRIPFEITKQNRLQKDTSIYLISENKKITLSNNEEFSLSEVEVETKSVKMNTIIVPHSKSYKITLSDGTKVWINACSQIRFPEKFSNNERVVEVEGEVYFDVTRDENRPFIVKTDKFTTRVLGTTFMVSSYKDLEMGNVSLVSGKVNVYNDRNSITLSEGKGVKINASTNQFEECDIDLDKINTLIENKFIFINRRLGSIISEISRWYGVKIFFENEELQETLFYIRTDKTGTLDQFMRWMSRTNNINYELKNNLLTIKKKN